MTLFDHLSVGVPSIEDGAGFYNGLLATIGVRNLVQTGGFAAYGSEAPAFLIMLPENGVAAAPGNGVHIAFKATSREAVDAFHNYAVKNNGACAGAPGPRPGYPKAGVYTTFVLDPYGNKLEAIFNGFAA
jgi:catechol 2,3-dioxygenase-like lactoylglutathione lyase family enzyme